jgi:polysaccharide transporter, PST family
MIHPRLRALFRHKITQNVLALYWVQVATFVVPLITLPYVSRVLAPSQFGLVLFSQSFSIFLTLLIDWGFTPYGVRQVATDRDDRQALTNTVARTRTAQLLMVVFSVPITLVVLVLVPKFGQHPEFLVMAWVAAASAGLMPNWYFVGAERVRLTASVQLGFRILGAALTFVFVTAATDGWIVMALYTASSIGMWVVSDFLVYRRLPFRLDGVRAGMVAVRESGQLFVGTIAISLLSTFNVVLLGLLLPSTQVAQFATSERVVRICQAVLGPIGVPVYPRVTALQASGRPDRARRLVAIATALIAAGAISLALVIGVFAPLWIHIVFGERFVREGAPILRILVLLLPLMIFGSFSAMWLMTLHRDRLLVRIALVAGLLNVALGSTLTPLVGLQGMAWSVVIATSVRVAGLFVAVYRIRDPAQALFVRRRHPGTVEAPLLHPGARLAEIRPSLHPGARLAEIRPRLHPGARLLLPITLEPNGVPAESVPAAENPPDRLEPGPIRTRGGTEISVSSNQGLG